MNGQNLSAEDLRVAIARSWRRPLYYLAPLVGVHPATLSKILHEKIPLDSNLADRIAAVVRATDDARRSEAGR